MERKIIFTVYVLSLLGCTESTLPQEPLGSTINSEMFEHHYVVQDLPGVADWGYGCPAMADFDKDGDLDYAFTGREAFYWFENQGDFEWIRHEIGTMPMRHLGATTYDVDKDGWEDIIIGGFWYRNPQTPRSTAFERFQFDNTIESNIHDIVMADMDGNGTREVVLMGEGEGVVWYKIPDDSKLDTNWPKTTITLDPLVKNDHIHSGFFPNGINDLDGDGDNDLVLPDRWLENVAKGKNWVKHQLPFGKRGPFGLSSRSWIVDLDQD